MSLITTRTRSFRSCQKALLQAQSACHAFKPKQHGCWIRLVEVACR